MTRIGPNQEPNKDKDKDKSPAGSDPRKGQKPPSRGLGFVLMMVLMLSLLSFVIFNSDSFGGGVDKQKEVGAFIAQLNNGEVKSITIVTAEGGQAGNAKIRGEYATEGRPAGQTKRFEIQVSADIKKQIEETALAKGVEVSVETESNFFLGVLMTLLPFVLIGVLVWALFLRRGSGMMGGPGNVFSFGRSRAKMFNKEEVTVRFSDVAGVEEAKEELEEIVQFLKNPGRFTRIGAKIPRGVIMFGPPGCGKTLLAKAIAGEAERPFFSISGSDFVEMFVGVGASRVRDLFRTARENAPCIVFVDEIDAVGRKRGTGVGGGHDEREQTLNAILVEMDGIGTGDGIIVIAATNRPDVLDPALLRPGRFDRRVVIDLPDAKGREEIFKVHLNGVKLSDDIDASELAHATPGFSGADIANMINEAALAAVLDDRNEVQMADLLEARDKVRFGRQKRSRLMDEEERRVTAYHEAGHAVIQSLTEHTDPVHKITIIPRGLALGATMTLPEKDRYTLSVPRAEETLQVLYGGRIAEEKFIGVISSGAENDIERATDLATSMVVRFGFSPALGPVNYAEVEQHDFLGGGMTKLKGHSDETSSLIDKEIRRILDAAYQRAVAVIESNRERLEALAQALLRYETLDAEDVRAIMGGRSIEEKRRNDAEKVKKRQAARKLSEAAAAHSRPDVQSGPSGALGPRPA